MKKIKYEKPIVRRLGHDSKAKGTDACTTGPTIGNNNCNLGASAARRCGGGSSFGQPTVCIAGPAVS